MHTPPGHRLWIAYAVALGAALTAVPFDQVNEAGWILVGASVVGCAAATIRPGATIAVVLTWSAVAFVVLLVVGRGEETGFAVFVLGLAALSQVGSWLVGLFVYGLRMTSPRRGN